MKNEYVNFPKPEEDLPHSKGVRSGLSNSYSNDRVYLYFLYSKRYYCKYAIKNLEYYLYVVRANRLDKIGVDDLLGYEINGSAVIMQRPEDVQPIPVIR